MKRIISFICIAALMISVLSACAVFLLCGMWIVIDSSGKLSISLNLAVRAIAEALTAVTLVHSLTKKSEG